MNSRHNRPKGYKSKISPLHSLVCSLILFSCIATAISSISPNPPNVAAAPTAQEDIIDKEKAKATKPTPSCSSTETHAKIEIKLIASKFSQTAHWSLVSQATNQPVLQQNNDAIYTNTNAITNNPIQYLYTTCIPRTQCRGHSYKEQLMLSIRGDGRFDFFEILVDGMMHNTLTPANSGSDLIIQCQKSLPASYASSPHDIHDWLVKEEEEKKIAAKKISAPSSLSSSTPPSIGWELAILRNVDDLEDIRQVSFNDHGENELNEGCIDPLECYFFFLHQ